ncbi:MAG: fibronectin type III domain-containing protein [Bacteroidales bacterium]|nr:fibronectin type III domain-containing protein [Bacteroidales bacterium]
MKKLITLFVAIVMVLPIMMHAKTATGTHRNLSSNVRFVYAADNPASVTNLNVSVSLRNAEVTWTAATDPAVTGYKVEYRIAGAGQWDLAVANTANTAYTIRGLYYQKNYEVRVTPVGPALAEAATMNFATGCASGSVFGNDVQIGTGNTTSSYLPSYGFYDYSMSEQIYRAEEIGQAGTITSLQIQMSSVPMPNRNIAIYLVPTDETSLSYLVAVPAGVQPVFDGYFNFTTGWNTINFTIPFEYDGSSNLMVVVNDKSGGWSSSYNYGQADYTNSSFNSVCGYQDDTQINPYSPSAGSVYSISYRNNMQFHVLHSTCDTTDDVTRVVDLAMTAVGRDATITWNVAGENAAAVTGYNVEYKTTDAADWVVAAENTPNTSLMIGNLYYAPTYQVRVTPLGVENFMPGRMSFQLDCPNELVSGEELDVTIGEGTTGNSYLPSYTFYNYALTEQIYDASDLGGNSGTITSVSFYNDGSPRSRKLDIYMMNTAKTAFTDANDWITPTSDDLVYSNTTGVSLASGTWTTITFDVPFEYDGTSNVVLIVDDNTGSYSSGQSCYITENNQNKAIYVYSDDTNYNPFSNDSYYGTLVQGRNNVIFHVNSVHSECDTAGNVRVQNLAVTTHRRTATATWDAYEGPGANHVTGYKVEYKATTDADWTLLTDYTYNRTWDIPNLYYDHSYIVRVTTLGTPDCGPMTANFQLDCPNEPIFQAPRDITVGNGTTQSYEVPINNYYKYTYTQQIYTAQELEGAGQISSIAFDYAYTSPSTYKNDVNIYMGHTTKSTFSDTYDYIPANELQLVYSGSLNCSQGWNTFTLNAPFAYNGTDNLVVVVDDNSGDYNNSYYTFNTHLASARSITYYTDDFDINPNDPFDYDYYYYLINDVASYRANARFHFGSDEPLCDTITCHSISNLTALPTNSHRATVAWTRSDSESDWDLILSETPMTPDMNATPTQTVADHPSCQLTALSAGATYYVYVRSNCGGEDGVGPWVGTSFTMPQVLATLPYNCDFESEEGNNWILANGNATNQWVVGSATGNPGQSLYISNDNGASNNYVSTDDDNIVWAYRDIVFPANENGYELSFDWRCVGEGSPSSAWDFLNVYFGDPAEPLFDGTIPSGANSLFETYFVGASDYQHASVLIPGMSQETTKRLYFLWYNDYSYQYNPAASVDNISIKVVNCLAPENVVAHNISTDQAELSWGVAEGTSQWDVYFSTSEETPSSNVTPQFVATVNNPLTLTGLEGETTYYAFVRTNCGNGQVSQWVPTTFKTHCEGMATIPYAENFETTDLYALPECWIQHSSYTLTDYPRVQYNNGEQAMFLYTPISYTSEGNQYNYCYAATLPMDLSAYDANSLKLSFKSLVTSTVDGALQVGFMTDPDDLSTFVSVMTLSADDFAATDTWYEREVLVPAHYTQPVNLVFLAPAGDNNSLYVDDILLDVAPNCSDLSNLDVTADSRSAMVTWDAAPYGNNAYTVEYKSEDDANWTLAGTTTETQMMLSDLTESMVYSVRVTTDCAEATAQTADFTTLCLNGAETPVIGPAPIAPAEVSVGEDVTTHNVLPTNDYYYYSLTEQIYLASEMGGANQIRTISFHKPADGVETNRTVDVYLLHTDLSEFNSGDKFVTATEADKVYSGSMSIPASDGWVTLTLPTPFEYNGTQNLLLIVDDNTGQDEYPYSYFYGKYESSLMSLALYADNTNYSVPNATDYYPTAYTFRDHVIFNMEGTVAPEEPAEEPVEVTIGTETNAIYCFFTGWWGWQYEAFLYDFAGQEVSSGVVNSIAVDVISSNGASPEFEILLKAVPSTFTLSSSNTFTELSEGAQSIFNSSSYAPTIGWNTFEIPGGYQIPEGYKLLVLTHGAGCTSSGGCSKQVRSSYSSYNAMWYSDHDGSDYGPDYSGDVSPYLPNMKFVIVPGASTPAAPSTVTESVEIGTGTSTTGYYPTYSFYNNSYTQQVYTAEELGEAGTITDLSFNCSAAYPDNTTNTYTRRLDIYLMPTTETSTNNGWLPFENAQLVYSGNVDVATGWNKIEFSTPYNYDGTNNVAVLVFDHTGYYGTSNKYYYSTISGTSSVFFNDNYDISTNPYGFNGSTYANSYYYYNYRMNAKFGIEREAGASTPDEGEDLTQQVEIGTGTSTTGYYPTYSLYNYSYTQQVYTAEELGEAGTIMDLSFNCATVYAGNSAVRTLDVYLMPTTETSTNNGWLPFADAQLVYSGSYPLSQGWNKIEFSEPYDYDGTTNVAVLVFDHSGNWDSSNQYYYSTISGTSSVFFNDYDDISTNPYGFNGSTYENSSYHYYNYRMNAKFGILRGPAPECDNDPDQCVAPNPYLSDNSELAFTMEWAAGGYAETGYEVYLATTRTAPDETTTPTGNTTTPVYTFDNLDPHTTYYAYVRANCSETDFSEWAGPVTYTTTIECQVQTLPYSENFNTASAISSYNQVGTMPDCWDYVSEGADNEFLPKVLNNSNYAPECGDNSNYLLMITSMAASGLSQRQLAILPEIENLNGTNVSFTARMSNYDESKLQFGYVDANNQFTALKDVNTNFICGQQFTYTFCGTTIPADARLAFQFATFNSASPTAVCIAMIDNIEIEEGNGTISDFDGNTYNIAPIGSHCWMLENLRSEHYSNGAVINGAMDYNNDPANTNEYGKLYTWYAVSQTTAENSAIPAGNRQGACPSGWHIPTMADYAELLVLANNDAAELKSTDNTQYWMGQFGGNNPGIGFNAVPAGYYNGNYNNLLGEAYFWTTENVSASMNKALCLLYYCPESFWKDIDHQYGLSVRCVRD